MGRKLGICVVLGGVIAAMLWCAPAIASTQTDESEFVRLLNGARTSRGLSALSIKSDLTDVARRHARNMAAARTIYHNRNLGSQVDGWKEIGENVGTGPRAGAIHDAFMKSAPHRANILHATFNQVGVGVAMADGNIYVVEVFARRTSGTATKSTSTVTRTRSAPRRVTVAAPPVKRPAAKPPVPEAPARVVAMLADLVELDGGAPAPTPAASPPIPA